MATASFRRTGANDTWVDNAAHRLHHRGRSYPCDREIEALCTWREQPLLLSSDTDCLSLWDADGPVRTARVGVYPQDMAISGDRACVCGGADGMLHVLTLPGLYPFCAIPLPGMPERIALHGQTAYVLTLMTEPAVHTALLEVDLPRRAARPLARYDGLPGAICAADGGLWVAAGEVLMRLTPADASSALTIAGFGLIRRLLPHEGGVIALDPLEERATWISASPELRLVPLPAASLDFTRLTP